MHAASRLLPHRLVEAFLARRVFKSFAESNGLLYFGSVDAHADDHAPVRGFTMSARTADEHVMTGTVGDRDVTLLRRTDSMAGRHAQPVTWVIVSIKLGRPVPSALIMSHGHPRDVYEAAYIGLVRSEHVALDYRIDAEFLVYARRADAADLRDRLDEAAITAVLARPGYDYEFMGDTVNVCLHSAQSDTKVLTGLLAQALAVAEALDGDM